MIQTLISCFMMLLAFTVNAGVQLNVTNFAQAKLTDWQQKSFYDYTQYQIVARDDRSVLQAISHASASGLALEYKVDLLETPYINWSWLVENRLLNIDERTKKGDDYAARLYIIIGNSWKIWQTKALNYVWSSNQPIGSVWNNAFVKDKAKMIAVRGKKAKINKWYAEKRNVYQDLILTFGDKGSELANQEAYQYIDVIAFMTDTDNSQKTATAYYGDVFFTTK